MTDSGIALPGLDLMIGGPLALVARGDHGRSAAVLVRGGPGTGKSITATWIARNAAEQLGGDVVYACVELLPRELAEQVRRTYAEASRLPVLVPPWGPGDRSRPSVFASTLDLGTRDDDEATRARFVDVVPSLFDIVAQRSSRGAKVVVIDAVSAGYGLAGAGVPRGLADATVKWAADKGVVLIVVEETTDDRPSAWSFAVDVVIELDRGTAASGVRAIRVTKNRFGPAIGAAGELDVGVDGPQVRPPLAAYAGPALTNSRPRDLMVAEFDWPSNTARTFTLPPLRTLVCAVFGDGRGQIAGLAGPMTSKRWLDLVIVLAGNDRFQFAPPKERVRRRMFGGQLVTAEQVMHGVTDELARMVDSPLRWLVLELTDPPSALDDRTDALIWAMISLARAWQLPLMVLRPQPGPPLNELEPRLPMWTAFDALIEMHDGTNAAVRIEGVGLFSFALE